MILGGFEKQLGDTLQNYSFNLYSKKTTPPYIHLPENKTKHHLASFQTLRFGIFILTLIKLTTTLGQIFDSFLKKHWKKKIPCKAFYNLLEFLIAKLRVSINLIRTECELHSVFPLISYTERNCQNFAYYSFIFS